jgi:hypothetical protein
MRVKAWDMLKVGLNSLRLGLDTENCALNYNSRNISKFISCRAQKTLQKTSLLIYLPTEAFIRLFAYSPIRLFASNNGKLRPFSLSAEWNFKPCWQVSPVCWGAW